MGWRIKERDWGRASTSAKDFGNAECFSVKLEGPASDAYYANDPPPYAFPTDVLSRSQQHAGQVLLYPFHRRDLSGEQRLLVEDT